MQLADPWWLLLLLLVPLVVRAARRPIRRAAVRFPSLGILRTVAPRGAGHRRLILLALRAAALMAIVLAMTRPQAGSAATKIHREGVDVMLAVDISGSMLAEDFTLGNQRANRLQAVKSVVKEFVAARPEDRIGLVLFAARPYTQAPLTLDHGWLLQNLDRAEVGMIEDGTAIGSALATAGEPPAPVDGEEQVRRAAHRRPEQRREDHAADRGRGGRRARYQVYTVGAGTRGLAPYPAQDIFGNKVYRPMQVDVDEDTLQKIATTTHARYFRATDTPTLREIYAEIDRSEKTPFEAPEYLDYRELYPWLLWPALAVLLIEIGLAETKLRKLPDPWRDPAASPRSDGPGAVVFLVWSARRRAWRSRPSSPPPLAGVATDLDARRRTIRACCCRPRSARWTRHRRPDVGFRWQQVPSAKAST
jgi:Ca-activated chloride channel family protein